MDPGEDSQTKPISDLLAEEDLEPEVSQDNQSDHEAETSELSQSNHEIMLGDDQSDSDIHPGQDGTESWSDFDQSSSDSSVDDARPSPSESSFSSPLPGERNTLPPGALKCESPMVKSTLDECRE